jgi:hypothetical protein
LAFVTQGTVMKGSNLALRLEQVEDQPEPAHGPGNFQGNVARETTARPRRPRRPFAFRAIVIRDQGLRPFRCR